jgi:hypothetical protein
MIIPAINKLTHYISFLSKKKIHIDSDIVGTGFQSINYTVNARHLSNYAAAISDLNDTYYSTDNKEVLCSHPLFPVRISWEIIKNFSEHLDKETPFTLDSQLVHQSEYIKYTRLPKPGDVLTLRGEIAALTPHPKGVKLFLKFDYYDQMEGLIFTEYIGSVLFGYTCTDSGRGIENIPQVQRIENSDPIWTESFSIRREAPYIYDGCTDIIYPVHTDKRFAQSMGLPDIILQGTASLGMTVSRLIKNELNNTPRDIQIVAGKFTNIVVPPNKLTVQLLKQSPEELFFDVKEQSGQVVIRGGYIKTKRG